MAALLMRTVDRGELVELLSYALLKVPPTLRAALVAPEQAQRRQAEALIADRIARDMDQLEIASAGSLGVFAADVRQADLPY